MSGLAQQLAGRQKLLIAVAALSESKAVLAACGVDVAPETIAHWEPVALTPQTDLVVTGVGKSAAAGGVASVLLRAPGAYAGIVSSGIAGALPPAGVEAIGSLVIATRSVFADEGVQTPAGFETFEARGMGPMPDGTTGAACDGRWLAILSEHLGARAAPIATVSTCSGTDAVAREVVRRTGAVAEAMEGAAVGLVAARVKIAFAEVRVLSNTTGDRGEQVWKLTESLANLGRVVARIAG